MKLIRNINPPVKPPNYMITVFAGGLGDSLFMFLKGHFAQSYSPDTKYFVVDRSNNSLISSLLEGRPFVAGKPIRGLEHVVFPFPTTFNGYDQEYLFYDPDKRAKEIDLPVLDVSLRPNKRYAIIHPFSSSDGNNNPFNDKDAEKHGAFCKDILEYIDLNGVCEKISSAGLIPVIVGRTTTYDFGDLETHLVYKDHIKTYSWGKYEKVEKLECPECAINLINKTSVDQLIDLVRHATFVVGSHSSVATLAFTLGTPCLCILNDLMQDMPEYRENPNDECAHRPGWQAFIRPLFRLPNKHIFFSDTPNFETILEEEYIRFILSMRHSRPRTIHRPNVCPRYKTSVLTGGLGDAMYEILRGSFARQYAQKEPMFVANNTHHKEELAELLRTCPKVVRIVPLHDHIVSPFPLVEAGEGELGKVECPLLPDEPSLRPVNKYVVVHPMSSNAHDANYEWGNKDMSSAISVQTICDYINIVGLVPVLVGKTCTYEYKQRLFGYDSLYDKKEELEVSGAINLMNKTSTRQLLELVRHAEFVVGSHSSVAHMAWGLGVPCFCALPDYFHMYHHGRPEQAWPMYLEPLFTARNGFIFFSHASFLDRFFVNFLLKNGYKAQTRSINRKPMVHRLKKGLDHAWIRRICRQKDEREPPSPWACEKDHRAAGHEGNGSS